VERRVRGGISGFDLCSGFNGSAPKSSFGLRDSGASRRTTNLRLRSLFGINGSAPSPRMSFSLRGRRTLGVRLATDGNETAEFNYLDQLLRSGGIRPVLVIFLGLPTVLKSLQYPLAATPFAEKQCTSIVAPCFMAGLPTSAICRTFPQDLVYDPLKYHPRLSIPGSDYTLRGFTLMIKWATLHFGDEETNTALARPRGCWKVPHRVTVYAGTIILFQATRRIKVPIAANSQVCTGLHCEYTPSANSTRLIKEPLRSV
jgi:hypothetical protein